MRPGRQNDFCVLKIIIGIRVVLFGLDPIISSLCLIIIFWLELGAEPVAPSKWLRPLFSFSEREGPLDIQMLLLWSKISPGL